MQDNIKKELITDLSQFTSEERLTLFNQKLEERTNHITLILEDVFQSRNISAAIRSADCFGIQNIHVIENKNNYTTDEKVSLGSNKWVTINRYNKEKNNTETCLNNLKNEGYKIIAMTPHAKTSNIQEINIKENKIAILIGSELEGLSKEALDLADETKKIATYGFTESLNLSVSAAICLKSLRDIIQEDYRYKINKNEKEEVMLEWLRKSIKSSKKIEEKFLLKKKVD